MISFSTFSETTQRRYAYEEVIGETKRAWIVKVAKLDRPVRLPKMYTDFEVVDGKKVLWVSTRVAEFVGLIQETTL